MESLTKHILKYLKNEHTRVELKEDFKGNYYSFIIDTIYIAKNFQEQKVPTEAKNINKKASELVVVCHECIHSIQSKCLHILNMLLSNLSIILAIINIVLVLFWTSTLWLKIFTIIIILTSIIIRLILEVGAVNGSIKLASVLVSKAIVKGISKHDIEEGTKFIEKHKYLATFQMVVDKIILLILVLVIK